MRQSDGYGGSISGRRFGIRLSATDAAGIME